MLHLIKSITDSFFKCLADDPVRPNIPHTNRIGENREIFCLYENDAPKAITCVSFLDFVPTDEQELFKPTSNPTVAVFYTIWSYAPGAGRQLIFDSVSSILSSMPSISRIVTLSPKTRMAQRFHLNNGAVIFRENQDTVNYEYKLL
jgi:hypothetical protein